MKKSLLVCALALTSVSSAYAQNQPNPLRFMVGIGLTAGGDNVATVQYTDGSSSNISAGTGVQMMTGLDYRIDQNFSAQATIGYQTQIAHASNGDLSFDRFPIELLGYYHINNQWRVGGGVRFVNSPKLNGSGAGAGYTEDYNSSTGFILEAEYFPMPRLGIKFRAVKQSYTPSGQYNAASINGDHAGVFADYYFF
jgi:hypothetical protein